MPRLTATVTINAAFFREIKVDNQQLRLLLDEIRRWTGDGETPAPVRVAELLALLRDQLAFHFTLEEAYGYFEGPLEAAPQLSHAAEQLREQHSQMYGEVSRLAEAADESRRHPPNESDLQRLRFAVQEFLERLEAHERREEELILDALETDFGGGD